VFGLGDEVELTGEDARKTSVVLRKRVGDEVELCDSSGRAFVATLIESGERVRARLSEALGELPAATLEVALAQAIPKGVKMDFVVEKATELGVARILPVTTERTLGADSARDGKVERWRRLARAAAQQSGRTDVPGIEAPIAWAALCARFGEFDLVLVPWELTPAEPLRERLPDLLAGTRSVLVAIGPEGGLSHAEVERAVAAGAIAISLGRRILRTETAGLVACSLLLYAAGEL
jgi:16S rRNA (uracil1498-N3)-methyltransferase